MVNYPYGRSSDGEIVSYNEVQNKQRIIQTSGDDESFELEKDEHKYVIRYDAPRQDKPRAGHLSIWVKFINTEYNKCYLYVESDNKVYENYTKLEDGDIDIYQIVDKENIDILMR